MKTVADLRPVNEARTAIVKQLEQRNRVFVIGGPGTGHTTLATQLLEELPRAHVVRLPPSGPDSALHGLVQMAACLPSSSDRGLATDDGLPVSDRARLLAGKLAAEGIPLIVTVPSSWTVYAWGAGDELDFAQRNHEWLKAVSSTSDLTMVVLSEHRLPEALTGTNREERLRRLPVAWEALDDPATWGELLPEARVVRTFEGERVPLSPVSARLAVGFLALGGHLDQLNRTLFGAEGDPVPELAQAVANLLDGGHASHALVSEAQLVARCRYALPLVTWQHRLGGLDARESTVLRQCLTYGDDYVRMSETVRLEIQAGTAPDAQRSWELAELHRSLDGAPRPSEADGAGALHWMERAHHLAHAGRDHQDEWLALVDGAGRPRDLVWEHARSLSREYRLYREAASLFRQCRDRDPKDAYAWHYFAFNAQRALERDATRHSDPAWEDVDGGYQRAVALEPKHPWYQGRYVSFLIGEARFADARRQWQRAVGEVDLRDPVSTAMNLHRWVVLEWLRRGRVQEALAAYESLDDAMWKETPALRKVRQVMKDAEEVERLGTAVYPSGYPVELRWQRPRSLPDADVLEAWYPARVLEADTDGVSVAFSPVDEQRGMQRTIPADQWETAAGQPAARARGFYFIGLYREEDLRIVPMRWDDDERLDWTLASFDEMLRDARSHEGDR